MDFSLSCFDYLDNLSRTDAHQASNSSATTKEPVRPPAPVTKMVLAKATAGDASQAAQQAAQKQSPSKGFKILLRLDPARPNAMISEVIGENLKANFESSCQVLSN